MRRAAYVGLVALAACSGTGVDEGRDAGFEPDASTRDGGVLAGDFTVEVGTGLLTFEPVADDEVLDLVQGPQNAGRYGGYHIWMAVKIADIEIIEIDTIALTIQTSTGTTEAMVTMRPTGLPFEPCEGGQCVAGFAPRFADCCRVAGREVTLTALVTAKNRKMVSDSVVATAGACLDRGAPLCP